MKVFHLLTFLFANKAKGIVRIVLFSGLLLTGSIVPSTLTAQGDNNQSEWRVFGLNAAVFRKPAEGVEVALRTFPVEFWKFADVPVVNKLIDVLENGNREDRQAAAQALGQIEGADPKRVVSALTEVLPKALSDGDDFVARAAVQALGQIGGTDPKQVVSALTRALPKALSDGDDFVARDAIQVLGQFRGTDPKQVVSALTKALSEDKPEAKLAAVHVLGQIESADPSLVVPPLIDAIEYYHERVRLAAAQVLGQIGGANPTLVVPRLTTLLRIGDTNVRLAAALTLVQIGDTKPEQVVPALVEAFLYAREPGKDAAAHALAQIGSIYPKQVVPALIEAFLNINGSGRNAAAHALAQIADTYPKQVVPTLINASKNNDGRVSRAAAEALGQIGGTYPTQVVPALTDAIQNRDELVRLAAAEALGQIGGIYPKQVVPALIVAIQNRDELVRLAAAEALGQIGDTDPTLVVTKLTTLFSKGDDVVRQAAALALGQIEGTHPKQVVSELIDAIKNGNWRLKKAVALALGKIGGTYPKLVVTELTNLPSDNPDTGLAIAHALGLIGGTYPKQVVPALTTLLSNDDDVVRQVAALGLELIGGAHPNEVVPALPALTKMLLDDEVDVVIAAAQALGKFEVRDWKHIIPVVIELPTKTHAELHRVRELLIRQYVDYFDDRASSDMRMGTSLVILNQGISNHSMLPEFRLWARFFSGDKENENGQILVDWLANAGKRPIDGLDNDDTRAKTLMAFSTAVHNNSTITEGLNNLRGDFAEAILLFLNASKNSWEFGDLTPLVIFRLRLSTSGFSPQVQLIDEIITDITLNPIAKGAFLVWSGHATLWVLLIFAYPYSRPVQAFFFWNKWVRWFVGFGYVTVVLAWVPFLRRRLFLPFRTPLMADAQLGNFDADFYFDGSQASFPADGKKKKLVDVIPEIRGQIVLEGESGLGKTMFIRKLLSESRRIVVYLPATKCVDGVVAAIQSKVQGPIRDPGFLQSLVFAGAIDVIIDGLNEVSASTHARIVEFADTHFSGNLLISTQPMEWTPPPNSRRYEIIPLADAQILEFLLTRIKSLPEDASVSGADYENSCHQYIEQVLMETEPDSREADLNALSNPMDLTVIADILARGERPVLLGLRQQQYTVMATDYERRHNGRSFPLESFSERAYELRNSDREHFNVGEFLDELSRMKEHRMVVTRPACDKEGFPVVVSQFRHDKIMDFFLYQAFMGKNKTRQLEHLRDARFRGVYFLLATHLPYQKAMSLREILIKQAAETKDHSLCDQFVLLLEQRQA